MEVVTTDLSKQELTEIPFRALKKDVNWLILSDNKIKKIPRDIKTLKSMTRLAINDNRIEEIGKEIGECVALTWMDLTRNRLKELPCEVSNLGKLSGLGLSENEFESIPECIYNLKNLRKFGFFSNRISVISPDIKNLKSLVKLDLSNNQIKNIPADFCQLTNLSWLNLSNNKLRTIPPEINNLRKLEELGLGVNELEYLPDMSNLNSLRIFPVFKNKLKQVHPSLLKLKGIEKLDFSDNEITEFPYLALENPSIRYLNLRNNHISEISTFEFDDCMTAINMLDISENRIKYIPFRFLKAFATNATIRMGCNPYEKLPNVTPNNQNLLHICFTKILNNKSKIDPWMDRMFNKHFNCEYCQKKFVVDPYLLYVCTSIDRENFFVGEKMLCSLKCLKSSEK